MKEILIICCKDLELNSRVIRIAESLVNIDCNITVICLKKPSHAKFNNNIKYLEINPITNINVFKIKSFFESLEYMIIKIFTIIQYLNFDVNNKVFINLKKFRSLYLRKSLNKLISFNSFIIKSFFFF